ncbi:MAG: 4Fe-4S dicluster domain-containing protein, partial [Desulfobacterales bacterium]
MSDSSNVFDKNRLVHTKFQSWSYSQVYCLTCGSCAGSCPASGIDDFDPRKLIRMISLGFEDALVESRWPWICTMCGKCEVVCPMEIGIADVVRRIRSLRNR